jgi:amino acid transporter
VAGPASAAVRPLRYLGLGALVMVGLNSVIGGGIFILPARVAGLVGPASLAAYVVAGLLVLGIGKTLGRLAARCDRSGGPYAYVEQAFGPLAGFQAGWLFWLARFTAMANLMNGVGLYLGALLPALGRPWPRAGVILVCAAGITALNIAGIRQTSNASSLLAVLKLTPLLVIGLAGMALVDPARLAWATAPPPLAFIRSVLLLLFAFTGFEILTVPAEETLRPRSDMPRALTITVVVVCGVYLLVHTAALGALPHLGVEDAPLAALAAEVFGAGGRLGMTGVAALSMFGCALSALFALTRVLYAMAEAGRIPRVLGRLHALRRTPALASLLNGGLAAALAIGGGYAFLAAVSSASRLLIFLACCFACVGHGRTAAAGPDDGTASGGGRLVPYLTAGGIFATLFGLDLKEAVFGMIAIGAGWLLYLLAGRERLVASR